MARPGYDSPIGRQFHGLEGDTPIYDSELLRVDRFTGGHFFVEVGREVRDSKLVNVGHGDLLRMARAILQHLDPVADTPKGQ